MRYDPTNVTEAYVDNIRGGATVLVPLAELVFGAVALTVDLVANLG